MDTHPPIFSSNLEELRGPSFSTWGGQPPPPLAPLAGATEEEKEASKRDRVREKERDRNRNRDRDWDRDRDRYRYRDREIHTTGTHINTHKDTETYTNTHKHIIPILFTCIFISIHDKYIFFTLLSRYFLCTCYLTYISSGS